MMTHQRPSIVHEVTIGSCVKLQHTHTLFYIADIRDNESGSFMLAGGMKPITKKYVAVSENLVLLQDSNEHSVKEVYPEKQKSEAEVAEMLRQAQEKYTQDMVAAQQTRDNRRREEDAFRAVALEKMPRDAKAVIVAEYDEDQSDMNSDYHGSRTTKRLILAWSPHTRDLFPEMRKAALNAPEVAHLFNASEGAEHREKYSMGGGYYLKTGYRHSTGWSISKVALVYRKETEPDHHRIPVGEWRIPEKTEAEALVEIIGTTTIEQHTHTKHGFEMFIVIMADRVERDVFEDLRNKAQAMGGWYSRPWAGTPGGFAFKDKDVAESFVSMYLGGSPCSSSADPVIQKPAANLSTKLREAAGKLQPTIDDKFRDRLENTPKRLAQARHSQLEGYRLQRTQKVLRNLADLHDIGQVPPLLQGIKTKAAVYDCMGAKTEAVQNGYHSYRRELNEPATKDELTLALWGLIDGPTVDPQKQELQRLLDGLKFSNIPGYFPTPKAVVDLMLERADIRISDLVLEPSAGSGAIACEIPECLAVVVYEVNHTLVEILRLRGFDARSMDFMEVQPGQVQFDKIVANPPFENLQDIDHARHAFKFLKPGGRMVFVMSPSFTFRSDKKSTAFREWVEELGGEVVDLPDESFKESGTGVATKLLILDKE